MLFQAKEMTLNSHELGSKNDKICMKYNVQCAGTKLNWQVHIN